MAINDLPGHGITQDIIVAFYAVFNRLGYGYLETHYTTALERKLRKAGREVAREFAVRVMFEGEEIGFHRLDMVIDGTVVVEIKSKNRLHSHARRQLLNYLRATNLEVGLLLHFGPEPKFYRVYSPNRASSSP